MALNDWLYNRLPEPAKDWLYSRAVSNDLKTDRANAAIQPQWRQDARATAQQIADAERHLRPTEDRLQKAAAAVNSLPESDIRQTSQQILRRGFLQTQADQLGRLSERIIGEPQGAERESDRSDKKSEQRAEQWIERLLEKGQKAMDAQRPPPMQRQKAEQSDQPSLLVVMPRSPTR